MPLKRTSLYIALLLTLVVTAVAAYGKAILPSSRAISKIAGERWPVDQPIRICAIRIEFQPDTISGTTGTGLMGTGFDSTLIIDPLPHDRAYFADHLQFLRNYYESVSGGGVVFDTSSFDIYPTVEDSVYRLDHPMWHYNYNSDDDLLNRRLVELFVESTDKARNDVNFSAYDAIFIFHAGVGKDFSLGYDLTPFDIPSAYISEADIQGYTGATPVPPGITRGLILPEGENQQEALELDVELSLNGIMVKLFGNWLGLPDLFNTRTGLSGVGRWGMMDQGSGNIFALVPAMPTAWSRVYMGWEQPLVHVPSGRSDTLHVARAENVSAPHVIKIPVTQREYYLIENRDADADSIGYVQLWDRNGLWMKVDLDQNIQVQEGFRVAVSASHYDFGIPGSGILIWHIDEDVIEQGLTDNTVNNDPDHRGVDLVEADGPQDIGREYGFATAGSGTELGIQEDAWYWNNPSHREANSNAEREEFTDATFPSSRLYDRSYTRLHLSGFSSVDSVMSFICRMDNLAAVFPLRFTDNVLWTSADLNGDGDYELYFQQLDSSHVLTQVTSDSVLTLDYPLTDLGLIDNVPPVDIDWNPGDELLFSGARLAILGFNAETPILRVSEPIATQGMNTAYFARSSAGNGLVLLMQRFGSDLVRLLLFSTELQELDTLDFEFSDFSPYVSAHNVDAYPSRRFVLFGLGKAACISLDDSRLNLLWEKSDAQIESAPTIVSGPDTTAIYFSGLGYFNATDGSLLCSAENCNPPDVDWDGNGIPDGGGWLGKNSIGREDAPVLNNHKQAVCDLNADGLPDLLGWDRNAMFRVSAKDHSGIMFAGFPLAINAVDGNHSPYRNDINHIRRPFRFGSDNALYVMSAVVTDSVSYYSPLRLTDADNTERFEYTSPDQIINIGPYRYSANQRSDWLYCWPNPTSTISNFRITVGYPVTVDIRIFDLAGRLVVELRDRSTLPEPFEIGWDVSHVESGVYIGIVKVQGGGGVLESQVKIAVVK
ncbi:MAG: T9SS type A sorting domain-containing protein [Calditrichota bacterium]